MQVNILSTKSQKNLRKASNKGGKVVSPTDSIDLGSVVAALSFIFGNVVMAFILSSFLVNIRIARPKNALWRAILRRAILIGL